MDSDELEKYVNFEKEESIKLFKAFTGKDNLRPFDFFKISPKEPYGSSVSGNYYEFLPFLPMFKTFLIRIFPISDPAEFQRLYGLNVEQMLNLYLNGRVTFLLEKDPIQHPYPDYLDPILKTKPPIISYRNTAYRSALNTSWVRDLDEGNLIYYGTDTCELYASEYAQFKTFGYDSIVELLQKIALFDRSSIHYRDASGIIGKIYASFLLRPYDIALDGLSLTRSVDRDLFSMVKGISSALHSQSKSYPSPSPSLISMDLDIGKYLIDACEIHLPNDIHTILKIESKPFQKAYNSLNEAVEQKQKKNIEDKTLALYEAIHESNEIIDSMETQSKTYENVINYSSVSAAIIGPTAALITGNPIFGTVSSLGVVSRFAAPIADKLVKINKPDHIVFIHDTQKLKKTK